MNPNQDLPQRISDAIARPWWKPADSGLLARLRENDAQQNRAYVRWGMWAAVVSYVAYGALDVALLPDVARQAVATRVLLGIAFLLLIEFCIRKTTSQTLLHIVAAAAIVVGGVGWLIAAIPTVHQHALSYFMIFGTVFILGSNLFFNFRLWLSAVSSTVITVAFAGGALFFLDMSTEARIVLSVFFVNCLVLSLYLSWRLGWERYHTYLHSLQARLQEQVAIEQGHKLHEIANTDHLTGLKNRRAIARDFETVKSSSAVAGVHVAVILIDVDYFKRYNDRLGHQAGDDCLVRIAKSVFETAERNGAIAGRHGGEEFVVLCKVSDRQQLFEIAAQFCGAVEKLRIVHPDRGDGRYAVTISAGASLCPKGDSPQLDTLLQEADRALYASKFGGRAMVTVYDPDASGPDRSAENLSLLLKSACAQGLLRAAYQPIQDARTGTVVGYETLMRLKDFDGTSISPNVFIPEAERTGAIIELGNWMIERACQDREVLGKHATISVNVSGVQMRAVGFPLQVASILDRYQMPPGHLAVELTEGIDMFSEPQALHNVEELRELGVQIWLDDFGTGFAGLAWLRQFAFDVVKIDRGFLHDCQTEEGVMMLKDIIDLLRHRNVRVLVEGIETEEQESLLRTMRVDLLQGFRFGKPESVERAARYPSLNADTLDRRVRV